MHTHVDWSRQARKKRQLEAAGVEPSQSSITDYFIIADKLSQLVNENQKLLKILWLVTPLLHHLMQNAQQNTGKKDKQRRHSLVLKKFATLLYIFSGSMAYEFIQSNMPEALPSLKSVQNIVHHHYAKVEEGIYRYDDLVVHLKKYDSPFLVAIAEDATRIVQRVEYDPQTNRCVGFVLPVDDNGIPKTNAFIANTFEEIEKMFTDYSIAKYAYLYTATPLKEGVPSFTLACIGTDNKFTFEQVLKRWQCIFSELKKRGIRVISFAADGDSRLLKAMRVMYGFSPDTFSLRPTKSLPTDSSLNKWLCGKLLPLLCVQDIVHLGVKLKARLLKPAIILPLGSFIASSAHLRIIMGLHSKDRHGLRHRDIDHRDRQNFDAVEHIISASTLLDDLPDALGTKLYINLIQSSIHSFLDKNMSPQKRLEEIWYSVFFIRYWRSWICHHTKFNLQNNFITGNAYMCIEINAHSLLAFILIMRDMSNDSASAHTTYFNPWLLGSQSCERTFRLLRSMTGNFSTIVNFSMLGFLQRIHKLAVKDDLESKEERMANKIKIPRMDKHVHKDGIGIEQQYIINLSNNDIIEILSSAETKAKESMEKLGMANDLKEHNKWEIPPIPPSLHNLVVEEDDNDDDDDKLTEAGDDEGNDEEHDREVEDKASPGDDFISSNETISEIIADVDTLHENEVVDDNVKQQVKKLKTSLSFVKDQQSKFPVYLKKNENETEDIQTIHSPFVEVKVKGRNVYIRKTTAIWLFQDTERVSSDRLFRVRAIQPGGSQSVDRLVPLDKSNIPIIADFVVVGDICAFEAIDHWKIGRVLQFQKYNKSGVKAKAIPHIGNYGNTNDQLGILCTWYECYNSERKYVLCSTKCEYYPISNYICTLQSGCFEDQSISDTLTSATLIPLDKEFTISQSCFDEIQKKRRDKVVSLSSTPQENAQKQSKKWISIDKLMLTEKEKTVITNGQQLSDIHITAAQRLLKAQFSHLNGLQTTVYQLSKPLTHYENVIQILNVNNPDNANIDHWSVLSTVNCGNTLGKVTCSYYDSAYSTLPFNTDEVIAQLLTRSSNCFDIKVSIISIGKQTGCTDCGLYAVANATSLAHDIDPATVIFRQEEMRAHFIQCIEERKMKPFPVAKARRHQNPVIKEIHIYSCPICCCGDNGSTMVQCDGCNNWYHVTCVDAFSSDDKTWYGKCCNNSKEN